MKVKDTPYAKFRTNKRILRDELAIDRTLLANERTLLAYLRSAVALLIAGVSIMQFSTGGWFWGLGIVCIPIAVVTGLIGIARYRKMNESIAIVRRQSTVESDHVSENGEP